MPYPIPVYVLTWTGSISVGGHPRTGFQYFGKCFNFGDWGRNYILCFLLNKSFSFLFICLFVCFVGCMAI